MPEKNEKQKTASPQIFDVAKAGKLTPADATSRPVIVTNRAIMRDPMMAAGAGSNVVESPDSRPPTAAKVMIKPLTETDPPEETALGAALKVNVSVKSLDSPPSDKPITSLEKQPTLEAPEAPIDEPESDAAKENDTPASASDAGLPDTAQAGKAAAAEEAAVKLQEELEEMVEKKQYFLPVNSVEKRRSRLTSIFGLMLIIILGLLLLNILLDAGFVQIDGLRPFTHFFSNP